MKNSEAQLQALSQAWSNTKAEEIAARDKRIAIEDEIIAVAGSKEEGTETITLDSGVKIKITGKIIYKADNLDEVVLILRSLPDQFRAYKVETKLDESKIKKIRMYQPALWRELAMHITAKPAKTYVVVVPVDGEDEQ